MRTRRQVKRSAQIINNFFRNVKTMIPANKEDVASLEPIGSQPPYTFLVEENLKVFIFETKGLIEHIKRNASNPYSRRELRKVELMRIARQGNVPLESILKHDLSSNLNEVLSELDQVLDNALQHALSDEEIFEAAMLEVELCMVRVADISARQAQERARTHLRLMRNRPVSTPFERFRVQTLSLFLQSALPEPPPGPEQAFLRIALRNFAASSENFPPSPTPFSPILQQNYTPFNITPTPTLSNSLTPTVQVSDTARLNDLEYLLQENRYRVPTPEPITRHWRRLS